MIKGKELDVTDYCFEIVAKEKFRLKKDFILFSNLGIVDKLVCYLLDIRSNGVCIIM